MSWKEEFALMGIDELAEKMTGENPMSGTILHGAKSLYNTGAAGIDIATGNDPNVAADHATDAAIEAVEAIPIIGSFFGLGVEELGGDEALHDGVKRRVFGHDIPDTSDPHNAHVGRIGDNPDAEAMTRRLDDEMKGPVEREENPAPDVDLIHKANIAEYQEKLNAWNKNGGEKPLLPERAQAWKELDTPKGQARLAGLEAKNFAGRLFDELF